MVHREHRTTPNNFKTEFSVPLCFLSLLCTILMADMQEVN
jgi:hypothetical protein